jgi:lipopolysaccharide biosynthesis regulator YciM
VTPSQWLVLAVVLLGAALALLFERLLRRRKEAQAYLKGVRYVLSDDADAAIEALSDAARLGSPEAVETYLALGALFRRTGDLARAIRLHRNMLLRPGLDPLRRREVERELAHDYRRGGMLEDSLTAYRRLAAEGDRDAAEGLRDVLVEMGRIADAAEVQRRLRGAAGDPDPLLAHLLAAQARSELSRDAEAARAAALAAVATSPRSADALLALAEAEGAAGRTADAREAIEAALDEDPSAALLAWPAIAAAGDGTLALVDERLSRSPGDAALHFVRGRLLWLSGRPRDATAALRRALECDTTGEVSLAMRDLLREAETPAPEELADRHDLMVAALTRHARPVRCKRCGAEAPTRQWRCHRCGAFESFVPPPALP